MSKDLKHRKDARKKPTMTLKERRAKKHEKQEKKQTSILDQQIPE